MIKNSVRLIGNLGKDVELRKVGDTSLGKTSLAVNDKYKNNKGETVEKTDWFNVTFWGKTAELANMYLKKGTQVAIEGSLTTSSYEKADGTKVQAVEIRVEEFLIVNKKSETIEIEAIVPAAVDSEPF
jgi:single-strand DNA-binding protein